MSRIAVLLTLLLLPFSAFASHVPASDVGDDPESIVSYDVTVAITPDGGATVTEDIVYDFGANNKHGIVRAIPSLYEMQDGTTRRVSPVGLRVTDGLNSRPFVREDVIRIGDASVGVTGQQRYVLTYGLPDSVLREGGSDVLRLDLVGDAWDVPVLSATGRILLPGGVFDEGECFTGGFGSTERACYVIGKGTGELTVGSTATLEAGEAFTVEARFPVGVVTPAAQIVWPDTPLGALYLNDAGSSHDTSNPVRPGTYTVDIVPEESYFQPIRTEVTLAPGEIYRIEARPAVHPAYRLLQFGLPVVILGLLIALYWNLRRRYAHDASGYDVIIPQYDVPKNFEPVMANVLVNNAVGARGMLASVLGLASRGFMDVQKTDDDFTLIRKDTDRALLPVEEVVFKALFKGKKKQKSKVALSIGMQQVYKKYAHIIDVVETEAVNAGYYTMAPPEAKKRLFAWGFGLAITGLCIGFLLLTWDLYISAGLLFAAWIPLVFLYLSSGTRTKKGSEMRDYLKGYQEYLEVAEEDRLAFSQTPKQFAGTIQALLPFAVVLGVEKTWGRLVAKYFKEEELYSWMDSANAASSIAAFSRASQSAFTATGSGGGYSGGSFSGGSFSGGGFSGGGGGSW